MGVFDTLYSEFRCPACRAVYDAEIQTKAFVDDGGCDRSYTAGTDVRDYSTSIREYDNIKFPCSWYRCESCERRIQPWGVIRDHVFTGIYATPGMLYHGDAGGKFRRMRRNLSFSMCRLLHRD